jgi:hypothetical protein
MQGSEAASIYEVHSIETSNFVEVGCHSYYGLQAACLSKT